MSKQLGIELAAQRQASGVTFAELKEKEGLTAKDVMAYEKGNFEGLSLLHLNRLLELFGGGVQGEGLSEDARVDVAALKSLRLTEIDEALTLVPLPSKKRRGKERRKNKGKRGYKEGEKKEVAPTIRRMPTGGINIRTIKKSLPGFPLQTGLDLNEKVFFWDVPAHGFQIQVFSSFDKSNAPLSNQGFIRVSILDTKQGKVKIQCWSGRIRRTDEALQTHLASLVGVLLSTAHNRRRCPKCSKECKLITLKDPDVNGRKHVSKQWWGCSDYPLCNGQVMIEPFELPGVEFGQLGIPEKHLPQAAKTGSEDGDGLAMSE